MSEETNPRQKISKAKIYGVAIVGFLLVNFGIETLITLIENQQKTFLYPIFPYTRSGLLIITILATSYYIRVRTGKPKVRLPFRIGKYILLALAFYGLVMGSIFALDAAEIERLRQNRPNMPSFQDMLPEPYNLESAE
ncbi:MAG TPA: hypothetical protein VMY99_01340 [Nevskiaceae bacterium]|nr:hypothetical protein [Nevskiaceae bacterium]